MNGTVLDILIYVFDRYMFDEAPEVPERETLARDLESAGFGEANVERALDWLERAYAARQMHTPFMVVEPRFERLRGMPRFDALVRRLGLRLVRG